MVDIYTQTLITTFSPETWDTQGVSLVERVLGTPGGQWFWANYGDNYPLNFRNDVGRVLQRLSTGPQ
jgi:hypothetical protein